MRWIMYVLVPALAGAPLAAQGAPGLTLDEVYSSLASGSPRIAAAAAQAAAARARIGPVSRWPDPAIQLGLMNRNLPGLGLQDPLGMNQIQVMQMVPVAGKTGLAVKAARADADAEDARAREVGWEVRARAAMTFYDLYQAERTLATMATGRRLLQDIIRTTESMYAEGKGRQTDVLRGQVELARMDEEILRMTGMRDGMAIRLNALRGLPGDAVVPTPLMPRLPDSLPARDVLEADALAGRPMFAAGQSRIAAADATARRAAREIWPDLTLGVIYGQRPMMGGGTERMGSFMLGFTLPLAAGSRQHQMTVEARAMKAMATADLEDMQAETRGRIGEVHADLTRATHLARLYHTTLLPQLRVTATAAMAAYQSGGSDFMTLLDSQMAVIRAEQELYRFDADAGKAYAELEMLTATELVDAASTTETPGGAR